MLRRCRYAATFDICRAFCHCLPRYGYGYYCCLMRCYAAKDIASQLLMLIVLARCGVRDVVVTQRHTLRAQ